MAQGFIFEGLTTTDAEGNVYPWLARSYELVETNDIDRVAYEDYMETLDADDEGVVDTDEQIIVRHPDDDPIADDEVRVLLPSDAADAVADGVFGMQYRYELHEGVEFSNGEELTAEHVVNSLRRYENSQLSAQTFDSVLHIEEVDEYTVDIFGQIVDAEAEGQLPGFVVFTEEQAQAAGGEIDPRAEYDPVGTGPYVLSDFSDEQFAEYEKNDNYWLESMGVDSLEWFDGSSDFPDGPVIERLELEIIPDNATRSAALQNYEIDVTTGLNAATYDDFDASADYELHIVDAGSYTYIQYPLRVEPWDNSDLRTAVNHLVPRQAIVDNILSGYGAPAWTDIPTLAQGSGTADYDALEEEIRPTNEYDVERATEILEDLEASGEVEFPIEIQLETNADNSDRVSLVELIGESMEQTGFFEVEVETFEWNTYIGRVLDTEYGDRGHIPCIGLSGTFNPGSFCNALHHSENVGQCCNLVGVDNSELDDMIDAARYGADVAESTQARGEAYDEVWRLLAEERYSSITHFGVNVAVTNTDVDGFSSFPFDETIYSYALHAPADEQYAELNR